MKSKRINIITIIFFICVMFFLNLITGYISDDFHFKFVWTDFIPDGNEKPVSNFMDITESMKNYYVLSGGRVVPHICAYIFIFLPKYVFNAVNTAVFIFLGLLIYKISVRNSEKKLIWLLPSVYLSVILFVPSFGDCVLWISGAVNYMWPAAVFLFAYFCIQKAYTENNSITNIFACLLSLVSSATNEVTGGMLIIVILINYICHTKKQGLKSIIFCVCALAGMLFVITAPGNTNRAKYVEQVELFKSQSVIESAKFYVDEILLKYNVIILFIFIYLIIMCVKGEKVCRILDNMSLSLSGVAGIAALSLSGVSSKRAMYIGVAVMLAGVWKLISDIVIRLESLRPEKEGLKKRLNILHLILSSAGVLYIILQILSGSFKTFDISETVKSISIMVLIVFTKIFIICFDKVNINAGISDKYIIVIKKIRSSLKIIIPSMVIITAVFLLFQTYLYSEDCKNEKIVFERNTSVYGTPQAVPEYVNVTSILFPDECNYPQQSEYTMIWYTLNKKYNIKCSNNN